MPIENEIPGKNKPSLDNIKIDDEIYKLVDWFYPRHDFMQILQLYMSTDDIMNIMNCSYDDALTLYYKIRGYFGDDSMRILVPHFCHYMEVDESFIHLFLASLKKHHTFKRKKKNDETKYVNGSSVNGKPLRLAQVIENLSKGLRDSPETIRERIRQWQLANPNGEAMFKRYDNFRVVIYSDEVSGLLRIHLRTAQAMLKEIRQEYDVPKIAPISIRRFCFHFKYQEEEIRMGLACMYGEEYIAP